MGAVGQVVNLRAEADPKTAFVAFDQARVRRVLKCIAADFDELSGRTAPTERHNSTLGPTAAGVEHRRRLAEPGPDCPRSVSASNETS
jgi:hypothetical protein